VECANRYGFMANVFDGYTRPALGCELINSDGSLKKYGSYTDVGNTKVRNEDWKLLPSNSTMSFAKQYCDDEYSYIVPSDSELLNWAQRNGPLNEMAGWPTVIKGSNYPAIDYAYYYQSSLYNSTVTDMGPAAYALGNDIGNRKVFLEKTWITLSSANDGALTICKAPAPTITTVNNPTTFPIDAGFPTTAFAGAKFKLNMSKTNAGYSFTSDAVDAPVDDTGIITINDKPAGEVTITASKQGEADFEYKFTIEEFYSNTTNGVGYLWSIANSNCLNAGLKVPSQAQLSTGVSGSRGVGQFWQEWGRMDGQGWATPNSYLYSSTPGNGWIHGVEASGGGYTYSEGTGTYTPYCYK
jgi:hypothetical protein